MSPFRTFELVIPIFVTSAASHTFVSSSENSMQRTIDIAGENDQLQRKLKNATQSLQRSKRAPLLGAGSTQHARKTATLWRVLPGLDEMLFVIQID